MPSTKTEEMALQRCSCCVTGEAVSGGVESVWCVLVCGVHIHHLLIPHTGTSPWGPSTLYQFYGCVNNIQKTLLIQ